MFKSNFTNEGRSDLWEMRDTQIGKKGVTLFFLPNDMIMYGENPKKSTQKLQELRSELSKVT